MNQLDSHLCLIMPAVSYYGHLPYALNRIDSEHTYNSISEQFFTDTDAIPIYRIAENVGRRKHSN